MIFIFLKIIIKFLNKINTKKYDFELKYDDIIDKLINNFNIFLKLNSN